MNFYTIETDKRQSDVHPMMIKLHNTQTKAFFLAKKKQQIGKTETIANVFVVF
jgi:hypothetical protein